MIMLDLGNTEALVRLMYVHGLPHECSQEEKRKIRLRKKRRRQVQFWRLIRAARMYVMS